MILTPLTSKPIPRRPASIKGGGPPPDWGTKGDMTSKLHVVCDSKGGSPRVRTHNMRNDPLTREGEPQESTRRRWVMASALCFPRNVVRAGG